LSAPVDAARVDFRVTPAMVERFGTLTGDVSSLHGDPEFGRRSRYSTNVVQGMLPVLFLSTLRLDPGGPPQSFRSIAGSFHAPVAAPDELRLTASLGAGSDGRTEVEYAIAFASSGTLVTRGRAVLEPVTPTALPRPEASASPALPLDALSESVLELDQIQRGDRGSLAFRVSEASLDGFRQIVEEGAGRPPDHRCHPASLLATALYSALVGMVLPGRYAIFTGFQSTFERPIAIDRAYRLTGEVVFKSAATSTVVEQASISDALGAPCGSGRIQALVSRPYTSGPTLDRR
jgi:acyl dehydratase